MARHQSPAQKKTVERVMHEFKHGELKTARGKRKVKNPKQAIAIALHEAGASKYESPKENSRNLRRTKEKERRGETGQDAAEGKGRRKTAARTSTRKSSSTKSSSTKRTRTAAARSSSPTRSASAKRTSTTKRASGTKRSSSTKRAASTARASSTKRSAATKRATSTGRKQSSGDGKTRAELYKEASRRNISGRSKMSKAQLERALSR
jgi:Family of unknown function (DUF6496)